MARKSILTTNYDDLRQQEADRRAENRRKAQERLRKKQAASKAKERGYGKREEKQVVAAAKEFGMLSAPLQVRMGALLKVKEMLADPKQTEELAAKGDAFFRQSGEPHGAASDAGDGDKAGEAPPPAWAA